jgi:hypothetical protein
MLPASHRTTTLDQPQSVPCTINTRHVSACNSNFIKALALKHYNVTPARWQRNQNSLRSVSEGSWDPQHKFSNSSKNQFCNNPRHTQLIVHNTSKSPTEKLSPALNYCIALVMTAIQSVVTVIDTGSQCQQMLKAPFHYFRSIHYKWKQ